MEQVAANAATLLELEQRGGTPLDFVPLLLKHVSGDWGGVDEHDWKANDQALVTGARIISSYEVRGMTVWIISDAAYTEDPRRREVTTVLRPSDY